MHPMDYHYRVGDALNHDYKRNSARNAESTAIYFEKPIWFEPADLRRKGDLFITARYLPEGRSPDPCFHLDAKATGAIGPNEKGDLIIDLWETESTRHLVASMLLDITANLVTVTDGYVNGSQKGLGLPHLLISMAQNLTGWTRGINGFNDLLLD